MSSTLNPYSTIESIGTKRSAAQVEIACGSLPKSQNPKPQSLIIRKQRVLGKGPWNTALGFRAYGMESGKGPPVDDCPPKCTAM